MTLGQKLTSLREMAGKSRRQVAEFVGVDPSSVWRWETDQTEPRFDDRMRLAALFDVTIGSLQADGGAQRVPA